MVARVEAVKEGLVSPVSLPGALVLRVDVLAPALRLRVRCPLPFCADVELESLCGSVEGIRHLQSVAPHDDLLCIFDR